MSKKAGNPEAMWNGIASFYAGRPVTVKFSDKKPWGGGVPWGGERGDSGGTFYDPENAVYLAPFQKQMLERFFKNPRDPHNGPFGINGIVTLLHESIHGRPRGSQQGTGFKNWDDEIQATLLGSELVPDMLQRFFGIAPNSKLGKKYFDAATNQSQYLAHHFGAYGA